MAPNATQEKTERLLNLVVYLLGHKQGVTRATIRASMKEYQGKSDEAFERGFERDKTDLRDLGIPLIMVLSPGGHGDEAKYRIDRSDYQLPEISLSTPERAVLVIAARAWEQASLQSTAAEALRKLGVASELVELPPVSTSLGASEECFPTAYIAVRDRRTVEFAYLKVAAAKAEARRVQPYTLASHRGSWYLIGQDLDRDAIRSFRLSRVVGIMNLTGEPGSAPPAPADLTRAAVLEMITPESTGVNASIRLRKDHGHALRRQATNVRIGADEWDTVEIDGVDLTRLTAQVCALGPVAIADSPAELRAAVIESLTKVAQVHQ